jgi:hypothetical protein
MIKSSVKKNYINFCAIGDIDKIEKLIANHPALLKYSAEYGNGIYYTIKNLKTDATRYLINKGIRIDNKSIRSLINTKWRASTESYLFLKEFGTDIYRRDEYPMPYNEWLYLTYFDWCFKSYSFDKIYKLMKIENLYNKENLEKLLNDYNSITNIKLNKNYTTNIRDIQLNILLYN